MNGGTRIIAKYRLVSVVDSTCGVKIGELLCNLWVVVVRIVDTDYGYIRCKLFVDV